MAKLKSVTVDFEHKCITYRPEGEPEQRISVNLLYPDLFKAKMIATELPEGAVATAIAERKEKVGKSPLSEEQKASAIVNIESGESIERISRGLVHTTARIAARAAAEADVKRLLDIFENTLTEAGII